MTKTTALLASAALLGIAATAQAADMAVKAPLYKAPVVAVYDWTGWYFGVNAGGGVGRNRATHLNPGGGTFDSVYLAPQGGFGGGQVGYNWQTGSLLGPMVLGIEADIQGSDMSDGYTNLNGIFFAVNPYQKIDWFGTVRGRIGLATGPVLSYVTAGYAYANVKTGVNETAGGVTTAALSTSRMQSGWTVGSGVEASLGGNWTGKLEYLYLNLGNKSDAFTALTLPQTLNTEVRENLFRVGLNYRVGGPPYAPIAAANWTGFYLGGNVGSGTARDRTTQTFLIPGGTVENFNLMPDGINGGVQAGYNWQAANWVYGLEADIQASSQKDNKTCVSLCNLPAGFAAVYEAKLPWFGTARARLGYSLGSTLFYATGGYAYGSVKTRVDLTALGTTTRASFSETKGGWTVGAGIETPFTLLGLFGPNWTSKTEYLYVDLGTSSGTFGFPIIGGPTVGVAVDTRVTEHVFRTGLNYHFNSPVVAKY
jgi:outer membrane immunogenic protein